MRYIDTDRDSLVQGIGYLENSLGKLPLLDSEHYTKTVLWVIGGIVFREVEDLDLESVNMTLFGV